MNLSENLCCVMLRNKIRKKKQTTVMIFDLKANFFKQIIFIRLSRVRELAAFRLSTHGCNLI
jgi:hypothetical protein